MPNIDGKYTLTEIAKELNVVPTFINRIQREAEIGPSIGTKGKAASFDAADVKTFRLVRALRMIGFSFEDIKMLWKLEENLIKQQDKILEGNIPKPAEEPGSQSIRLILHSSSVYCSKKMDDSKNVFPYGKNYPGLLEILNKRKHEIVKRWGIFKEDLKKIGAELDAVLPADNIVE